jgi:hypothetical protein
VSTFLTGLVRRGAGLPSPVAIRPVTVPGPMADAGVMSNDGCAIDEKAVGTSSAQNIVTTPVTADSTARIEPAVQPGAILASVPRSTEVRAPVVPQKETTRVTESETERAVPQSSRPVTAVQKAPVSVHLHPALSISTDTVPVAANQSKAREVGETPPANIRLRLNSLQSNAAIPAIEPARQRQLEVSRPTQSRAALPQVVTRESAREIQKIEVRIGKVEIRSTQPSPVVQARRRAGTSGFEDLNMARNYFSRGRG